MNLKRLEVTRVYHDALGRSVLCRVARVRLCGPVGVFSCGHTVLLRRPVPP
jgi:hypothetical protein